MSSHRLTYVAPDYSAELDLWASNHSHVQQNTVRVQLPFDPDSVIALVDSPKETPIELERRQEANAERLREMHRVRRAEKLDASRRRAHELREAAIELARSSDADAVSSGVLQRVGVASADALDAELDQLEREIEQLEARVFADASSSSNTPSTSARKRARLSVTDERRRESDPEQWLRDLRAEKRRIATQTDRRQRSTRQARADTETAAGESALATLRSDPPPHTHTRTHTHTHACTHTRTALHTHEPQP
jgi:hypothetical protein